MFCGCKNNLCSSLFCWSCRNWDATRLILSLYSSYFWSCRSGEYLSLQKSFCLCILLIVEATEMGFICRYKAHFASAFFSFWQMQKWEYICRYKAHFAPAFFSFLKLQKWKYICRYKAHFASPLMSAVAKVFKRSKYQRALSSISKLPSQKRCWIRSLPVANGCVATTPASEPIDHSGTEGTEPQPTKCLQTV